MLAAVYDGLRYAIKKIRLKDTDSSRIMREVQTLSQLQHQHVVRYMGAWIEQVRLRVRVRVWVRACVCLLLNVALTCAQPARAVQADHPGGPDGPGE